MTREQRRARRDIMNPGRHEKVVRVVKSKRCKCDDTTGRFTQCPKHGKLI